MTVSRPNIVLIVVTVLSVAFGLYGFLFGGVAGGSAEPPRVNEPAIVADLHDPVRETRPKPDRGPRTNSPARTDTDTKPEDTPDIQPEALPKPEVLPLKRGDGVFTGTVADPQGAPLAGISVTAHEDRSDRFDRGTPGEMRKHLERLQRETFAATTNEAGEFRIEGVARGEVYEVTATHDRWGELTRNAVAGERLYMQFIAVPVTTGTVEDEAGNLVDGFLISWASGDGFYAGNRQYGGRFIARWERERDGFRIECPGFKPSDLHDESFKDRADIKIVLRKAPQLEVTVNSPGGEPVPRATVRLKRAVIGGEEVKLGTIDATDLKTDMLGRAVFSSLVAGEYEIACTIRDGGPESSATASLAADMKLNIVLDPGPSLLVRVMSSEGKPIAGFGVNLHDAGGEWVGTQDVDTGEPGETRLLGLPAAPLQVEVTARDYPDHWFDVDLTSGSQTLEVTLKPGGRLSGKVTDGSGNGLDGVLLKLIPPGGAEKGRSVNTYSNDTGKYESDPLLPGTWTVELYRDWMGERLALATVTIAEGENTQDFTLDSICVLKVVIEFEAGASDNWVTLWIQHEDAAEPRRDWITREENHEKRLSLKAGVHYISASSDELASPTREVEVVSGETIVRLRMARPTALRFTWIEPGSELSKAGIKTGDLLIEYNGQGVSSKADLNRLVEQASELNAVDAVVLRGKTRHEVKMPKIAFHFWLEPAAR